MTYKTKQGISPFQVYLDKPTYFALKELSEVGELSKGDVATLAIRLLYQISKSKPEFLTEAGIKVWDQQVENIRRPKLDRNPFSE